MNPSNALVDNIANDATHRGDLGSDGTANQQAVTIDGLGDIDVQDITFQSQVTDGEDDVTMTVYYHDQPRRH